jgi:hypothetical protein
MARAVFGRWLGFFPSIAARDEATRLRSGWQILGGADESLVACSFGYAQGKL